MNKGSKYFPLYRHLVESDLDELTLRFNEIEQLLGIPLPQTAQKQRGWWSNRSKSPMQARAWMDAGYHTQHINLAKQTITFRKPGLVYNVKREGNIVLWHADLIKALRFHMGMNQAEFAQELGIRQPTVSEWETGAYSPKRSSSKLLTLIAEKAGFTYE